MDPKVWMYLAYLTAGIGVTVWSATTLSRNGLVFLVDVFADEKLARAVNHLLTVGFYLLSLGYLTVTMRTSTLIADAGAALETFSLKLGLALLVLGALHFCNVFFLSRYRRSRLRQQQPPAPRPMPPYPYLPAYANTHPAHPQPAHQQVPQPAHPQTPQPPAPA